MNETLHPSIWPWGAALIIILVAATLATLGKDLIFRHEAQKLRYRILAVLECADGLLLFEISMLVRRGGQEQSEVLASLEALVSEGIVYKVKAISEFAPNATRYRYFLVRDAP